LERTLRSGALLLAFVPRENAMMKLIFGLAATVLATSAFAQTVPNTNPAEQGTSGVPGGVRPDTANPPTTQTAPTSRSSDMDQTADTTMHHHARMSGHRMRHHATHHRRTKHHHHVRHHHKAKHRTGASSKHSTTTNDKTSY
jgi:hypothetical protein